MLETSARLLRLLSLLQARREWPGAELSERLEVDVRTVRRDVEKLRSLGYVIHASSGLGGGYQMGSGSAMPPLLLDDDEAITVVAALGAAAGSVAKMETTALRVLVKLDQLLPARLRRRVSALQAVTVSLTGGRARVTPANLTTIAAACRDHERLEFDYAGREHNTTRHVEPLQLAHTGYRWYLLAWDLERDDWRTFRLDRLLGDVRTGARFTPRPPPEDIAAYVSRGLSHAPYRYRVVVRLAGSAHELTQRIPPWVGNLEALDESSCLLRTGAETLEGLLSQILNAGVEFELVEPLELASELRAVVERLARGLAPPCP